MNPSLLLYSHLMTYYIICIYDEFFNNYLESHGSFLTSQKTHNKQIHSY